MTKSYIDPSQAIAKQERALQEAKRRLNARGIFYPLPSSSLSDLENYQRIMEYSRIEAEEIVKILREPEGGERPLAINNIEPKKTWGNSYYD